MLYGLEATVMVGKHGSATSAGNELVATSVETHDES